MLSWALATCRAARADLSSERAVPRAHVHLFPASVFVGAVFSDLASVAEENGEHWPYRLAAERHTHDLPWPAVTALTAAFAVWQGLPTDRGS